MDSGKTICGFCQWISWTWCFVEASVLLCENVVITNTAMEIDAPAYYEATILLDIAVHTTPHETIESCPPCGSTPTEYTLLKHAPEVEIAASLRRLREFYHIFRSGSFGVRLRNCRAPVVFRGLGYFGASLFGLWVCLAFDQVKAVCFD